MRPRYEQRLKIVNFVMPVRFYLVQDKARSVEAAFDETWPVLDLLQAVPDDPGPGGRSLPVHTPRQEAWRKLSRSANGLSHSISECWATIKHKQIMFAVTST
jgi:hypothetical protein